MELSDTWRQTGPCVFSPNGALLAVSVDHRLVVRDVETLQIVQFFICKGKISLVEWASNSVTVLCALLGEGIVQAFSVRDTAWKCCITESSIVGLVNARWTPLGDHIITTSDFQIRINIWSTISSRCVQFFWPKHISQGLAFSSDGCYMALVTRHESKDTVNIVSCETWEVIRTFVPETQDLADIQWSPDSLRIAVWDSLLEFRVLVYSADGYCLFQYQAYAIGLGVRTVVWSPDGYLLAVGSSFDNSIHLLNTVTGKLTAKFEHNFQSKPQGSATIYKETEKPFTEVDFARLSLMGNLPSDDSLIRLEERNEIMRVQYEIVGTMVNNVVTERILPDKPNPKQGIGLVEWSINGRYILSRSDSMPSVLWIWDMSCLSLFALLIQRKPIRSAAWDPSSDRLALCTNSSNMYFWSKDEVCSEEASCVQLPKELSEFVVSDFQWSGDGHRVLLKSKNLVCCASLPLDEDENIEDDNIEDGDIEDENINDENIEVEDLPSVVSLE